MSHVKGYRARLLGAVKEPSFGTDPQTVSAVNLPVNRCSLKAERNLIAPGTIRGRRDAIKPVRGNLNVTGQAVVPLDRVAIGHWLQMLMGDPTSEQHPSKNLDAAPAVDKGDGLVGIPLTGHGYEPQTPITVSGTLNYDGAHSVLAGSSENEIVIQAAYAAETFDGTEIARAELYTHVFRPGDELDSWVMEVGYTDKDLYQKFNGIKAGAMNLAVGGEGELTARFDLLGARETVGSVSMDPDPDEPGFSRFESFDALIEEGGQTVATVQEVEISLTNNLDSGVYLVGGGGARGAIPEGEAKVTGRVKAMFEDWTLYNKAVSGAQSSLKLDFTHGPYSLKFAINELVYRPQSPGIETQGGVWIELPFEAYFEDGADGAVVAATLVNGQDAY